MITGRSYDVIVCGSGCAGFCAAIQAARAGMKTAVIEKYGISGGIMTVMGNNDIAQFCADRKMIIKGIAWEYVNELAAMGYADIPDMTADYKQHWLYGVRVNTVAAAKLIDDYYISENIDIYYNQPAVDVITEESNNLTRVTGIVISTKSGLTRLCSKIVIDCTGDGDICAWAGAPYECGDEKSGELQPGTIRYYLSADPVSGDVTEKLTEALKAARLSGKLKEGDLNHYDAEWLVRECANNSNHISNFNSADSDSKTQAEIEARRCILRIMDIIKDNTGALTVTSCAPEVATRESRRILCDGYITAEDYINTRQYPDAICYSFYPIDLHKSGDNGIYQIFLSGKSVPQIPLSALVPKNLSNVFVAGRCASGDRLANSAYRVKASCMAMGQAAGAAAASAVKHGSSESRNADLDEVKDILRQNGAIVP